MMTKKRIAPFSFHTAVKVASIGMGHRQRWSLNSSTNTAQQK